MLKVILVGGIIVVIVVITLIMLANKGFSNDDNGEW